MRLFEKIPTYPFAVLLLSALLFLGCDGGPGGDPPPPTDNLDSIGVDASVRMGGDTLDAVTITLENEAAASGWIDTTLEQRSEPNESVLLGVDSDEYVSKNGTKVLDLSRDRDYQGLVFRMEKLPDSVNVTFPFTESDTAVAADLYINNSLVAESAKEPTVAVEYGTDPVTARVEGKYFQTKEVDFTPDEKQMEVPITLGRRQVTVNVTPQDSTGTIRSETVTKVYEPYRSDSSKIEGKGSVELPARSGEREFFSDLITEEPDSDKRDRFQATDTFPADEGVSLKVVLVKLDACSDEIDNEANGGDGLIDEEDPGCANRDGDKYDPTDDSETHYQTIVTTGKYYDDSTFVSGTPSQRTEELNESNLPETVTVANYEIFFTIENKRLANVTNQHFRVEIQSAKFGTNGCVNNYTANQQSKVVADPDTATGFRFNRVHGFTRAAFAGGRCFKLVAHKAKPYGGPENKALFYVGEKKSRLYQVRYNYEEDHPKLQNGNSKTTGLNTTTLDNLNSGECRQVSTRSKVCKDVGGKIPLVRRH